MKVITVAGQKGGTAKTTTAVNIAAIAAQSMYGTEPGSDTKKVLLVDTDPQQSATWWCEQVGERLPFDIATSTDPHMLARLQELGTYDLVVVDTPGSFDRRDMIASVIKSSDFVVLPTEPSGLAINPLLTTIQEFVAPLGKPYRVLLNRVDPRRMNMADEARQTLLRNDIPCFSVAVRVYAAHADAPTQGLLATDYPNDQSGIRAVDDYRRVTLEIFADLARRAPERPALRKVN